MDNLSSVKIQIQSISDDELLEIVTLKSSDYTEEAINIAKEELNRRNLEDRLKNSNEQKKIINLQCPNKALFFFHFESIWLFAIPFSAAFFFLMTYFSSTSSKTISQEEALQDILFRNLGITCLIIGFVSLIALCITARKIKKTTNIVSLLPDNNKEFILGEDGIYIMSKTYLYNQHEHYFRLLPWKTLYLYNIDEKNRLVRLKFRRVLLTFKTKEDYLDKQAGDYFCEMKDIILTHLPENQRTQQVNQQSAPSMQTDEPKSRMKYRLLYIIIALFILIPVDIAVSDYYESNLSAKTAMADGRCTICRSAVDTTLTVLKSDPLKSSGAAIYEFCINDAAVYAAIHPGSYIPFVSLYISSDGFKDFFNFLVLVLLPPCAWIFALSFIIMHLKRIDTFLIGRIEKRQYMR